MKISPEPKPKRGYRARCADCGGKVTVAFFYKGKRYISADPSHDLCRRCYKAQRDRTQAYYNP